MLTNIIACLCCLVLGGCLTDAVLGEKAKVKYSSKQYEVKNSFGKHKYTPNNRYKLSGSHANGYASYYGGKFNGRKTASGVIFDENQMTAAHPTAVLPSVAKVTCTKTNRSVYVIFTDRGPFAKKRIADLSVLAATRLGYKDKGHIPVKIEILPEQSKILAKHWKKFLGKKLPPQLFKHIHSTQELKNYLK